MPDRSKPFGLSLDKAVGADELEEGQIVVLNGYVVEAGPDPDDSGRIRVVIVRARRSRGAGRSAGGRSDRPPDMKLGTARPFNIDLPPAPAPSSR